MKKIGKELGAELFGFGVKAGAVYAANHFTKSMIGDIKNPILKVCAAIAVNAGAIAAGEYAGWYVIKLSDQVTGKIAEKKNAKKEE